MIRLEKVSKSFGKQKVLDEIDFEIPKEKITIVIGRSGEGKSVLLRHLLGLTQPDSGKIIVDGEDVTHFNEFQWKEKRKKFGMLFQNAALFDSMTVFENVAFPLIEHTPMTENQIKDRVKEMLALVGLKDINSKLPSELSGGMRKRVGLARAIVLMPQIMLYDEPTTGLDPVMTDAVNSLISNTQKKLSMTSVVISHDIEATFRTADKIAMLHKGKILLEGTKETFLQSKDPIISSFIQGKQLPEDVL